jgi:predicted nucleic acid-binding protein
VGGAYRGDVGPDPAAVGTEAARSLMLLLDSQALSAVAHGPAARRDRVRALVAEMRKRELPIAVVATVLADVVRGRPADAAVLAGLRRERVEVRSVDSRVAVRAGRLLGRVRAGSELAIDAFTVAVADLAGGAVIATTDPDDLGPLAAHASRVVVADVT